MCNSSTGERTCEKFSTITGAQAQKVMRMVWSMGKAEIVLKYGCEVGIIEYYIYQTALKFWELYT